jgi:hypothetical protein
MRYVLIISVLAFIGLSYLWFSLKPAMDFSILGINKNKIYVSDEAKAYAKLTLSLKYPPGSKLSDMLRDFGQAGMRCLTITDEYWPLTSPPSEDGDQVMRCEGKWGGSRVSTCLFIVVVVADRDNLIRDFSVNIGCRGP